MSIWLLVGIWGTVEIALLLSNLCQIRNCPERKKDEEDLWRRPASGRVQRVPRGNRGYGTNSPNNHTRHFEVEKLQPRLRKRVCDRAPGVRGPKQTVTGQTGPAARKLMQTRMNKNSLPNRFGKDK